MDSTPRTWENNKIYPDFIVPGKDDHNSEDNRNNFLIETMVGRRIEENIQGGDSDFSKPDPPWFLLNY